MQGQIATALLLMLTGQAAHAQTATETAQPITIPSLQFAEQPEMVKAYDKYFYFFREQTSFADALADLRECDGYARGLAYRVTNDPHDLLGQGIVGSLMAPVGALIADRLFGVPERRKARRTNMRVCMGYKGYHRYGLPQAIWQSFNFDDAIHEPVEADRQHMLMQQAKIASGDRPDKPELK